MHHFQSLPEKAVVVYSFEHICSADSRPTMPYHPHPHIIICTSVISSIDYNVFIVLQCHLKDFMCRKVT